MEMPDRNRPFGEEAKFRVSPDADLVRALLIGLVRECPMGGNPQDCQIHSLRKTLNMEARVAWVEGLSDRECRQLYYSHLDCLRAKEQGTWS